MKLGDALAFGEPLVDFEGDTGARGEGRHGLRAAQVGARDDALDAAISEVGGKHPRLPQAARRERTQRIGRVPIEAPLGLRVADEVDLHRSPCCSGPPAPRSA